MTLRVVALAIVALFFSQAVSTGLLPKKRTVWSELPRHVKIGKNDYSITYVYRPLGNENLLGVTVHAKDPKNTDPKIHYIQVAIPESSFDEVESTVIHEILHAIAAEHHFPLPEKKVLQLEDGLFATLKENGWQINIGK